MVTKYKSNYHCILPGHKRLNATVNKATLKQPVYVRTSSAIAENNVWTPTLKLRYCNADICADIPQRTYIR